MLFPVFNRYLKHGFFYYKKLFYLIQEAYINSRNNPYQKFHRYTIVQQIKKNTYLIQCVNLSAVFKIFIPDIKKNFGLIDGLISEQACFLGIKYGEFLKTTNKGKMSKNIDSHFSLLQRYGKYKLCYENKGRSVCIINLQTNKESVFSLKEVVLTENLIKNFDSTQAFYIGMLAGVNVNNELFSKFSPRKAPFLRVVRTTEARE